MNLCCPPIAAIHTGRAWPQSNTNLPSVIKSSVQQIRPHYSSVLTALLDYELCYFPFGLIFLFFCSILCLLHYYFYQPLKSSSPASHKMRNSFQNKKNVAAVGTQDNQVKKQWLLYHFRCNETWFRTCIYSCLVVGFFDLFLVDYHAGEP